MATFQTVTQTTTPAPTFGELFGQALVRSVGAPIRRQREERDEFLKIAPALIQQGVLGPTAPDDPAAIMFGKKPLTVSGMAFRPVQRVDYGQQKDYYDVLLKRQQLMEGGLASKQALNDFYFSDFGPAMEVTQKYAKELGKAKTPEAQAAITRKINQEMASGFNDFYTAFRGQAQAISMGPSGPQYLVKDPKTGQVRPATRQELANPTDITPASSEDIAKNIGNIPEQGGKQIDSVKQAGIDLLKSTFATQPNVPRALGQGVRSLGQSIEQEVFRLPSRAVGAVGAGANVLTDFASGLSGQQFGKIPDYAVNTFLQGDAFTPSVGGAGSTADFYNLLPLINAARDRFSQFSAPAQ